MHTKILQQIPTDKVEIIISKILYETPKIIVRGW